MKNKGIATVLFFSMLLITYGASGESLVGRRAQFNYQVFCRGCHLPDASGVEGKVPRIKGYIGNFLKVQGGREFLVRVPGAANAAMDDEQLAELMNWIIVKFAGASLPENYQPYSADEVGRLRRQPLNDVITVRAKLVKKIDRVNIH